MTPRTDKEQSMSDNLLHYIPMLRAFARSLCRNAPDSDDLVQDTLRRAIEAAHTYREGTNMRAWLFTIMRNRFYTETRKRAREMTGTADCVSSQGSVPEHQIWNLRGKELERAVNALPIHYREAIVLVIVLGESYEDVSRLLDCKIGTVKSRVNRGRMLLRNALGEYATTDKQTVGHRVNPVPRPVSARMQFASSK